MSEAQLSDQAIHRIKSATRDIVRLVGGLVRAGEVCKRSKSEVARWQSPNDPDVIDLFPALALEADCSVPLITTVMAEINGRRLTDEVSALSAASLLERHAEVMRRSAELATQVASALADNTMTPAEAELVDRAASDQEEALRSLRSGLAAVKSAGPSCAGAPLRMVRA